MLEPKTVFRIIRENGINFITGVPDSYLKNFCDYLIDHTTKEGHVIAANEGNAIAIAAGYYLGTGQAALVYMQNSGFGNAINPLISLADQEVYSIPMLIMVGWRGEPGVKDEPQHSKQGRIMPQLLDVLGVPWLLLEPEKNIANAIIKKACKIMFSNMTPVVLLVKAHSFSKYICRKEVKTNFPMGREEAIHHVVDALRSDDIVISTTGKTSRELYEYRMTKGDVTGKDFLTVGSMGHSLSIAVGLAGVLKRNTIVCLDGDGSVIMHMGALAVTGQMRLKNLLHIVLNNGAHDSVGGQPTAGLVIDFISLAKSCGYTNAVAVESPAEMKKAIERLRKNVGPSFIEIRVNKGARENLGRPKESPMENKEIFMLNIGRLS